MKRTLRCELGEQRFTVLRVNGNSRDTHAARSYAEARELAMPDRGSRVEVFAVCAREPGEARMLKTVRGQLLRTMRVKR